MNENEYLASLIARRDAFNAIMAAHSNPDHALEAIGAYCDDPAAISSPSLLDNLAIFFGDNEAEITIAAEKIYMIGGIEFGKRFCAMNELCAIHFSDIENCIDDKH